MKISIQLSILNDAPVPFLQIFAIYFTLKGRPYLHFNYFMVYFNSKFINLAGYCIFKETERGVAVYHVSQNRFAVRHPIQSEKYGDAKSHMSTGFVPYFKDNYYE